MAKKGNMGQDAQPKNAGLHLDTNGWNSLKLIEFMIYRYFHRKIYDIIETKRLYKCYTKGTERPHFEAKRPTCGAKCSPPVYCPITVINLKPNYHLWWLELYLSYIRYYCGLLKFNHTTERCLWDKYHFIKISDHFLWMYCMFDTQNCICTLSLTNILQRCIIKCKWYPCIFAVNIS